MQTELPKTDFSDIYAAHVREWSDRFTVALEAARFDALVIFSGPELTAFRDDSTYPFSAEPYFKTWLPLSQHPGSAIRFVPGEKPRLIYFQDDSFWHAPPAAPEGDWLAHFELRHARSDTQVAGALEPRKGRVATIGPPQTAGVDRGTANDPTLLAHLDYTRACKTAYEVACIEAANAIAAVGHRATAAAFRASASEFELDQVYCQATRQRASALPYPNIIALNEHAAVLHYQYLAHTRCGTPGSLLIDAGATFNGYAADVTRTYCHGSKSMQALIAAMGELQQSLCAEVRSGIDFVALNDTAHKLLATVLSEGNLIRCSAEEAYERGITRTFFPHGLGHLLGVQVHDVGGHLAGPDGGRRDPPPEHPMLRLTRVLEPGFVVTIEPGLYFIPSLLETLRSHADGNTINWSEIEQLARLGGIRVEDDVLVTANGARNLTRAALG
jgi:Xaa-Pro dipeptidase